MEKNDRKPATPVPPQDDKKAGSERPENDRGRTFDSYSSREKVPAPSNTALEAVAG